MGSIPARAMCKADAGRGPRAAAEHRRQRGSQPDAAAAPDDPVDERIDDADAEAAERVRQHQRQPRAAEDVEQRTDNASGPRATPPVAPESPRVRHGSCPSDSAGGRRNSRPSSTSSLSRARRWRLARFCETDRARGPGRPRRRRRRKSSSSTQLVAQPNCRSHSCRPTARLYIAVAANYARTHAARPALVGTHQSQRVEAEKEAGDQRGRQRKKTASRGRVTWQRR